MSDHAGNHRCLALVGDWPRKPWPVPAAALPWKRPCRRCRQPIVIALDGYFQTLVTRKGREIHCICPACAEALQRKKQAGGLN